METHNLPGHGRSLFSSEAVNGYEYRFGFQIPCTECRVITSSEILNIETTETTKHLGSILHATLSGVLPSYSFYELKNTCIMKGEFTKALLVPGLENPRLHGTFFVLLIESNLFFDLSM